MRQQVVNRYTGSRGSANPPISGCEDVLSPFGALGHTLLDSVFGFGKLGNGGQQQASNGAVPTTQTPDTHGTYPPETPTGLLEASDGQRMDARAAGWSSGSDPEMETVRAVNRTADG